MKICIYTDVHFSQTSSIVRGNGKKYSTRLEQLIESVNWAENLAVEHNCDAVYNLGDFVDKSSMNAQEISAISEIQWAKVPHTCILGNHEIKDRNKDFSSLHVLKLLGFDLITEPSEVECGNISLCYLPYMFEYKSLDEIFPDSVGKKRIVFSHNDIEGIQLGGYIFDKGFSLVDISKSCELFLNGHIHAYGEYGNLINLGNLCGQNFGEHNVPHRAYILDTETLELTHFENPYALNFYKIDCTTKIKDIKLKNNAVLTIKATEDNIEEVKNIFNNKKNVIDIKYTVVPKLINNNENKPAEDIIQIDHLQSLREYILKELGETEVVKEELNILTK